MADFITLNQISTNQKGYTIETPTIFNKSLIKNIEEDRAHDQSWITYEGHEIPVRETLEQINSKCQE